MGALFEALNERVLMAPSDLPCIFFYHPSHPLRALCRQFLTYPIAVEVSVPPSLLTPVAGTSRLLVGPDEGDPEVPLVRVGRGAAATAVRHAVRA